MNNPSDTGATMVGPDLSIVLVCWNNWDYLEPCLHSLFETQLTRSFDVWVVDNGSSDGSQQKLREHFPDVQLIQNAGNVGLAKACNQGIEASTGRFILLLNNDTLVERASLEGMLALMESKPEAGAVGGKLVNPDGSFQGAFGRFSTIWQELMIATRVGEWIHEGYPSHLDDSQVRSVDWLSSACLLLRRSALDQVGLLDEEYFIYGDEADLQYRLKQAGWKVYYAPSVVTIHYGGRSMDRWRRRRMVYRGKMLFYQKNYGPLRTALLRMLLGLLSVGKLAVWSLASLWPGWQERSSLEKRSNLEVVELCWRLK